MDLGTVNDKLLRPSAPRICRRRTLRGDRGADVSRLLFDECRFSEPGSGQSSSKMGAAKLFILQGKA